MREPGGTTAASPLDAGPTGTRAPASAGSLELVLVAAVVGALIWVLTSTDAGLRGRFARALLPDSGDLTQPSGERPWALASRRPGGTVAVTDLGGNTLALIDAARPSNPIPNLPDIVRTHRGLVYLDGSEAFLAPHDGSRRVGFGPADAVIAGRGDDVWLVRRRSGGYELALQGPGVDARIVGVGLDIEIIPIAGLGPVLIGQTDSRLGTPDGKLAPVDGRVLAGSPHHLLLERCPASIYCAAVVLDRLGDGAAPTEVLVRGDRLAALAPNGDAVVELPRSPGETATVVDLLAGTRTELPESPEPALRYRWSPDGRHLFWSNQGVIYTLDRHSGAIDELGLPHVADSSGTFEVIALDLIG